MRWQQVVAVALGTAVVGMTPARGSAGWLTLAAGVTGSADPTAFADVWFNFPSGTPVVAVDQLTGTGTIQANAGGAVTHFGGLGVPVLLNVSDGTAYLASGEPPAAATGRTPAGVTGGSAASAPPVAGGEVPAGAALLGVTLADKTLTVGLTDGTCATLGTGSIGVPDGGWWVIGLGPDAKPNPNPDPPPTDNTGGGTDNPPPTDNPGGGNTPPPPPVDPGPVSGVPEPTTLALGLLGMAVLPARRLARGRK